jgi:hypothetical protein
MILVCSGDSFTHGMELWEEKNVPGYTELKTKEEALDAKVKTLDNEEARLQLTWPYALAQKLNCRSFNIGEDGCSEHAISQKTINKLNKIRNEFPYEKIVCIMQDTQLERVWLWCDEFEKNLNVIVSGAETFFPGNKIDGYEIKHIYLTKQPTEMLLSEYYLQGLAVKNFCINNDIDFLHFQMFRNWKRDDQWNKTVELSMIEKIYFDPNHTVKDNMTNMLVEYYQHNNFVLPGLHVNCEAQKIIAKLLFEELKIRGLV